MGGGGTAGRGINRPSGRTGDGSGTGRPAAAAARPSVTASSRSAALPETSYRVRGWWDMPDMERPEEFNRALRDFLAGTRR